MAHATDHPIVDDEKLFSIDATSRAIHHESDGKLLLVQGDHNSERFTFEIPLEVEGHKVTDCTDIEVHFINLDSDNSARSTGVYPVEDAAIKGDDENAVTFSWLISHEATEYVGTLNFAIKFLCRNGAKTEYAWNTLPYSGVIVSTGIDSSGSLIEDYADIIAKWYNEIIDASDSVKNEVIREIQEVNSAEKDRAIAEIANEVTNFTDTTLPRVEEEVKRELLDYGANNTKTIYTIGGSILRIFVGTQAEYEALTVEQKANLFAIITDDTAKEDLFNAIDTLNEWKDGVVGGSTSVKKAEYAITATSATSATTATSATKATKDGNGNVIADTYAKKSDLTDGTITVKKASNVEANVQEFSTAGTEGLSVNLELNRVHVITARCSKTMPTVASFVLMPVSELFTKSTLSEDGFYCTYSSTARLLYFIGAEGNVEASEVFIRSI